MSKKKHQIQINIKVYNNEGNYTVSDKVHNIMSDDYKRIELYLESLIEKLDKQD